MPVRSSNSPVLRWPDRAEVDRAAHAWIAREGPRHPELVAAGYFGSYARGDWGVGSDLDLVAIVRATSEPFERRALGWVLSPLPVPAQLLVYTAQEWQRLLDEGGRFARVLASETVWIHGRMPASSASSRG
ncbi:MAG: nucleotidyltransferase domain-containing protein [Myxococcales bacterium]|nr:nucleotidyltransferase domain-containing protein [Myxococcales bacterium]